MKNIIYDIFTSAIEKMGSEAQSSSVVSQKRENSLNERTQDSNPSFVNSFQKKSNFDLMIDKALEDAQQEF